MCVTDLKAPLFLFLFYLERNSNSNPEASLASQKNQLGYWEEQDARTREVLGDPAYPGLSGDESHAVGQKTLRSHKG